MNQHTITLKFKPSLALVLLTLGINNTFAQQKKPNILVIMADDIGINNVSAYGHGIVGYRTPNIDRLTKEGALLTDYYGQ
ncbi:MAG: sulfatase-like hydrolase/transferase [Bacteroidota bacterium]